MQCDRNHGGTQPAVPQAVTYHGSSMRRPFLAALAAALLLGLTPGAPWAATPSVDLASTQLGGIGLNGAGIKVDPGPDAEPLPTIKAKAWVLADATTGAVLAAKNPHAIRRPASTLKVLTALTVLPILEPAASYTAKYKEANAYGSRAGIIQGKTYTIDQLMYGLMLPSGNDASIALAQANGGVKETVAQMNQVATNLQAVNTTARNTSGLDAKGQFTTAYDLTLIARAALQRDDFREYVGARRAEFPTKGRNKTRTLYNQNRLLTGGYKGAIGVKTGFTSKAGRTFIGAAERGGTTLIVTVMGSKEATADAAAKLLDWGFANDNKVTPVGELVAPLGSTNPTPTDSAIEIASDVVAADPGELSPSPSGTVAQASLVSTSWPAIGVWGWPLLAVFLVGFGLITWRQSRRKRRRA